MNLVSKGMDKPSYHQKQFSQTYSNFITQQPIINNQEKFQKALDMEQPKELQQNLQEFIESLQTKIDETHKTLSRQLQNRKLADHNRHERDLHKIQNYENILKKIEQEINNQPYIKYELNYITVLKEFSVTLQKKFHGLNNILHTNYEHMKELQKTIQDLHIRIRDCNRVNLVYQENRKILLNKFKRRFYQMYNNSIQKNLTLSNFQSAKSQVQLKTKNNNNYRSQYSSLQKQQQQQQNYITISDDGSTSKQYNKQQEQYQHQQQEYAQSFYKLKYYKSEIENQKKRNQDLINKIRKKTIAYFERKAFLQNCLDLYQKKVVGEHKISNKKSGLAESIYLDISNQSALLFNNNGGEQGFPGAAATIINNSNGEQPGFSSTKNIGKLPPKSQLQDREIRNTLFDTIKYCMLKKIIKDDKEVQGIRDPHPISMERFNDFTPTQLISLLQIKPEYMKMMLFNLDLKEKATNLLLLKMNYLIKQNDVNSLIKLEEEQDKKAKQIVLFE